MFNGTDIGSASRGWSINNRFMQFKSDSETPRIISEAQGFYIDGGFATSENVRVRWYTDRLGIETSNIPGFLGLVYDADYSANFVDESLVSKRYVDAQIAGAGLGNIYTQDGSLLADRTVLLDQNDLLFENTESDNSVTTFKITADEVSPNRLTLNHVLASGEVASPIVTGKLPSCV